jgi:hypothetical protein
MVLTIRGGSTEGLDRLWIGFSVMAGARLSVFPSKLPGLPEECRGMTCEAMTGKGSPCKRTDIYFCLNCKILTIRITSDPGLHFLCF